MRAEDFGDPRFNWEALLPRMNADSNETNGESFFRRPYGVFLRG
jgi:hypothetical protein